MSEYVRGLRTKVGHDLLHVPAVSILTFDDDGRVLLVRSADFGVWTTPGGMVEPGETPSDAAVREMWEETGLHVELTRIVGVFGGPAFAGSYTNGDRVSWVSTVFEARRLSGEPAPDRVETVEVRYFSESEAAAIDCQPHAVEVLSVAFGGTGGGFFELPAWRPSAHS